jgi:hypothetical protein
MLKGITNLFRKGIVPSKSNVFYSQFLKLGQFFSTQQERGNEDQEGFEECGEFEVVSGKLILTDPCLEKNQAQTLPNCKKGTWKALYKMYEEEHRVADIIAHHKDFDINDVEWDKEGPEVGVDSGQACIFDEKYYNDHTIIEGTPENLMISGKEDKFYGACCDITMVYPGCGVLKYGFISASGFGDWTYGSYYVQHPNSGEICAVRITFIGKDDEEQEIEEEQTNKENEKDEKKTKKEKN